MVALVYRYFQLENHYNNFNHGEFMKHLFLLVFLYSCVSVVAQKTPIAQIKDTTLVGVSTKFVPKIGGRITVSNQFASTTFLQDASGGIALFIGNTTLRDQFRNQISIGDSVEIDSANLGEFNATTGKKGTGLLQLTSDANKLRFTIIPNNRVAATPRNVTINSIGESVESELLRLRNVHFTTTGNFQAGKTYYVANQNGDSVQVFIDRETELVKNGTITPIPQNDIDLIGVLSQFRGTYQLQPRFGSDIGVEVIKDTVPSQNTLDITTWNLYWFGTTDTTKGIKNKTTQFRNIATVLNQFNDDVVALQEVTTEESLNHLRDTLNTLNPSAQYASLIAPILQDQKMGYLYKQSTVKKIESDLAVNGGSEAWANGRFPLRMTINADINGKGGKYVLFVIHAKATSADSINDLNRRAADAQTFREYLINFYGNDKVIVTGDFNDDVSRSVVGTNPSPYKVFVDDAANFSVLTKELSDKGIVSYPGIDGAMLDNFIVSNEVVAEVHRTKVVVPSSISSYTSTTSDHYPVTLRLLPSGATSVDDDATTNSEFTVHVAPNPTSGNAMIAVDNNSGEQFVRISVLNSLGQEVTTIINGSVTNGYGYYTVPSEILPSGVYTIRVQRNGHVSSTHFVVAK